MAHIGLYFGSFNPIHTGHLAVAQHMLNYGPFDAVWFVVSPQNPFKENDGLLPQQLRLDMVKAAIADNPRFRAVDLEFHLPIPSYTIQTMEHLREKSENQYSIIMGADNLNRLHEWKDIEKLCSITDFHVYQRQGSATENKIVNASVHLYDTPFIDISATYIRKLMKDHRSIRYLVPDAAIALLIKHGYISK